MEHLLGVQRRVSQRVNVNFHVDLSGVSRAMPEDVGDHREGSSAFEETGSKRVAERMHAPMPLPWDFDPSQASAGGEDVVEVAAMPEWSERGMGFEKYLPMFALWAAMLQVVDQSLSDFLRKRKDKGDSRLRLLDGNLRFLPTNVFQSQSSDVAGAKPQPAGQEYDREVALSQRGGPVDHSDHRFNLLGRPDCGQTVVPPHADARDMRAQVFGEDAPHAEIPEECPQV